MPAKKSSNYGEPKGTPQASPDETAKLNADLARFNDPQRSMEAMFLQMDAQEELRKRGALLGQLYAQRFGLPTKVYYPASGDYTTLLYAFPHSDITYADPEMRPLGHVKKYHPDVTTLTQGAETVNPKEMWDVVYTSRSHAPLEAEIKDLKEGGHLISEERDVDRYFESDQLRLVGVIYLDRERKGGNGPQIITENLADYKAVDPRLEGLPDDQIKDATIFGNMRNLKPNYYVFEKIDERPEFVKQNESSRHVLWHDGKWHPYTVIERDMDLRLKGFLGFSNGHLFISKEVPPKFREFQLTHELIEFRGLDNAEHGEHICVEALKIELALVPKDLLEEYIKYRLDFFTRLVAFYEEYYPNSSSIEKMRHSRDYLKTLAPI